MQGCTHVDLEAMKDWQQTLIINNTVDATTPTTTGGEPLVINQLDVMQCMYRTLSPPLGERKSDYRDSSFDVQSVCSVTYIVVNTLTLGFSYTVKYNSHFDSTLSFSFEQYAFPSV